MNRNMAYYRAQRIRIINKKRNILAKIGGSELVHAWSRGELGRLSKSKIHCSCWMCRTKSYEYKSHSDKKKEAAAIQQILDCNISLY